MSSPLIDTIATQLAALTITEGTTTLTILDLGETPEAIDENTCPVMFSDPERLITDFNTERLTFGGSADAAFAFSYSLNYYVAILPVGAERSIAEIMPTLIDWARAIIGGIAGADDQFGNVLLNPKADVIGTITDPTGAIFHGLHLSIGIQEYR